MSSNFLQTTLVDNYGNIYYPNTFSNLIKRQKNNLISVEDTLIDLENKIHTNILNDTSFNNNFKLIFQDDSLNLFKNDLFYINSFNNKLFLNIGSCSISSDGFINSNKLKLNSLEEQNGNLLILNGNNEVGFKTVEKFLTESNIASLNSPSFIGTPSAPTPSLSDSSNKIATTEFVNNSVKHFEGKINLFHKDWGVISIKSNLWSETLDEFQYYTQKINIEDMKKEYQPFARLIITDYALEEEEKQAFNALGGITTYDGYIIIRTQNKPIVDLNIYLKGS